VFADGFEQAREQEFTRRIGARQKAGHQMPRPSALPFLMRKMRRIDEGTIGFVAVQKTFFKETVEGGHDRRVGERTAQLGDDVADAAFAVGPKDFHQFEFESAESQGLTLVATTMHAIFQEANHSLLFIGPLSGTGRIVSSPPRRGKRKSGKRPNWTGSRFKKWTANTRYWGVGRAGGRGGYTCKARM
jgi:hypothetical protein